VKPVILDCSIAITWCFQDETTDYSDFILDYVRKESALVPSLWLSEITNVLLVAIRKKRIDWAGALAFLEAISKLPIRVGSISSRESFSDILQLAEKNNLTTYDATYLYLAIREKKPFATLDLDLKSAARKYKLPKLK
jgi:predicted nucleic acid-binding protein